MDQIKIENLEIFANHGVYPEENRSQSLTVQSAVSASHIARWELCMSVTILPN